VHSTALHHKTIFVSSLRSVMVNRQFANKPICSQSVHRLHNWQTRSFGCQLNSSKSQLVTCENWLQ